MFDQNATPLEFTLSLLSGFRLSRLVWLAAHFRLADVIGDRPATA